MKVEIIKFLRTQIRAFELKVLYKNKHLVLIKNLYWIIRPLDCYAAIILKKLVVPNKLLVRKIRNI